jgi:hypothetical protein
MTTRPVHGATLLYVSQFQGLPQSALVWEEESGGDRVSIVKLHSSTFTLRVTLTPPLVNTRTLQKRLSDLYASQRARCEDKVYNPQYNQDDRGRMNLAEVSGHIPDDRWVVIHPTEEAGTYNVICTHHGVYMGLLDHYLRKITGGKADMILRIENQPYALTLSTSDSGPPLHCAHETHVPRLVRTHLLNLFGKAQDIDAVSVALPVYPPRATPGVPWLLADDYLIVPQPAQVGSADDTKGYTVRLPMTLTTEGDTLVRSKVRMTRDVTLLGLNCPLTRALLQWTPKKRAREPEPAAAPAPKKAKTKDDDRKTESDYTTNQLRPKRLRALADQMPYKVFMMNWTNPQREPPPLPQAPGSDADPAAQAAYLKARAATHDLIEAWCLLKQPRRADMGEHRVRQLAAFVKHESGAIPAWFPHNAAPELPLLGKK